MSEVALFQLSKTILDDLMFMAMNASETNLFFHLINDLYDHTAIVLTSNKTPTAWGGTTW
jgi:DNA replication protein